MSRFIKSNKTILFLSLIWILVWVMPWGKLNSFQGNIFLTFLIDMIFLGFALLVFIFPGILLYILLSPEKERVSNSGGFIPIGFTFSVLIVSLIGLLGRILGFSFIMVKGIFVLIGFLEICLLASSRNKNLLAPQEFLNAFRRAIKNYPLIFAIVLATLMMFHDQLFFVDDYSYLAYLTNWQYSDMLGFRNIVHDLNVVENARYWLAMLPMSQALIAELSGLSGLLLLGSYLELYLVPFAVITSYWLIRVLGISQKSAGFSVLFQIAIYAWMLSEYVPTGFWFYLSMSEDKVFATFLIFPTLLFLSIRFIEKPERQKMLLVILAGTAVMLTHPVMYFFSVCIILGVGILASFWKQLPWRGFMQLLVNFTLIALPSFFIRLYLRSKEILSVDAVSVSESFEANKIVRVVNDIFYGLAPESLKLMDIALGNKIANAIYQIFRLTPVIIILVVIFIALRNLKKGPLYWYIFSASMLTVLATIPYTGWILGYFVSGRMISRASWFLPLGLGVVLIWRSIESLNKNKQNLIQKNKILAGGLILSFIFISPILLSGIPHRFPAYFDSIRYYKGLSEIGSFIDQSTKNPVTAIALDYRDTQFLPGISANARLISFRERKTYNGHNDSLSVEEARTRIDDSNAIQSLSKTIAVSQYCQVIEKYDLGFVLANSRTVELFQELTASCERSFAIVFKTGDLILLASDSINIYDLETEK